MNDVPIGVGLEPEEKTGRIAAIWVDPKWVKRLMQLRAQGVVKTAGEATEKALEIVWGEFFTDPQTAGE